MSPSGQTLPLSTDNTRNNKDINTSIRNNNNNNTNLLRRASLVEAKCPSKEPILTVVLCEEEKKCNLPDVLPVNAKVSTSRSHFIQNVLDDKVDRLSLNTPPQSPSGKAESPKHSPVNTLQKSPIKSFSLLKSESPTSPNRVSHRNESPPSPNRVLLESPKISDTPSAFIKAVQVGDIIEQPKVIEGLQLIQRTEVTLRVNTCTIDAASQTENETVSTPLPTRRKLQEEIECEKLSQDLVNYLSPSDRLKGILGKLVFFFTFSAKTSF